MLKMAIKKMNASLLYLGYLYSYFHIVFYLINLHIYKNDELK